MAAAAAANVVILSSDDEEGYDSDIQITGSFQGQPRRSCAPGAGNFYVRVQDGFDCTVAYNGTGPGFCCKPPPRNCDVCLGPIQGAFALPCSHVFCGQQCLKPMIQHNHNSSCPTCRTAIPEDYKAAILAL